MNLGTDLHPAHACWACRERYEVWRQNHIQKTGDRWTPAPSHGRPAACEDCTAYWKALAFRQAARLQANR